MKYVVDHYEGDWEKDQDLIGWIRRNVVFHVALGTSDGSKEGAYKKEDFKAVKL